jgi:hypothetical protein
MGVITNLIRANREKKAQDEEHQLRAFTLATQSDDPALKQWGIQSITSLGEKNAPNPEVKKHIPVLGKIASLMGQMNPMPSAPKPPAGPAPKYDQGRADQEALRKATVEESKQAAIAKHVAKHEKAVADIQQRNKWAAEEAQVAHIEAGPGSREDKDAEIQAIRFPQGDAMGKGNWEPGEITFPGTKVPPIQVEFNKTRGTYRSQGQPYMPPSGAIFQPKGTAGATPTMRSVWVQVPGKGEPQQAYVNPKDPSGYVDEHNQELPAGTKSIPTPAAPRMFGQILGFYYAGINKGLTDAEARKYAGEMFEKYTDIHLGRVEQQAAIDQALGGIGLGPGISGGGVGSRGTPSGTPAEPKTPRPAGSRNVPPPNQPVAVSGGPAAPPAEDIKNMNLYFQSLFGNLPSASTGAARVGINKGMLAAQKMTGLSPLDFQMLASVDKDKLKGIGDTVERYAAMVRLNSVLDLLGPNSTALGEKITQTGSPFLNKVFRDIKLASVDDPALREYMISVNDMQRQYGTLTAGGALSRAMLPVTTGALVDKLLDPNQTLEGMIATVNQIRTQAKLEQKGFQSAIGQLQEEVKTSLSGNKGADTPTTTPPKTPTVQKPKTAAEYLESIRK